LFLARRERQKQSGWLRPFKSSQRAFQSRWILDDRWIEIIRNNCGTGPSTEKAEEPGLNGQNMVKAAASWWKCAREDFMVTTFRHVHDVTAATVNDEGDAAKQR
jgi:hypothetical protein